MGFQEILTLLLIIKIGAVPAHIWFVNLVSTLRWNLIYLFLTLQKFIPLMFISHFRAKFASSLAILSWGVAAYSRLTIRELKKVVVFSSLFFQGVLLFSLRVSLGQWVIYLRLYALISWPILDSFERVVKGGSRNWTADEATKFNLWLVLISVGGVPPLPGFFLKVHFALTPGLVGAGALIFFCLSVAMLWMYMMIGLSSQFFSQRGALDFRLLKKSLFGVLATTFIAIGLFI